jgi:hypothetical protein
MEKADLRKMAVDAAMERVVGSSTVPARYLAKLLKEFEKTIDKYKGAVGTIEKYETMLSEYRREIARVIEMKKGRDGIDGRNGVDGKDGADATNLDLGLIIDTVIQRIPKAKDGVDGTDGEVDYDKAAALVVEKIFAEKLLTKDHIAGLDAEIASYRSQLAGKHYGKDTWARGSGTTVSAGSNITLVPKADGTVEINASGGGSGTNVVTQYQLTATQAGSNVEIDLNQLTNYATFADLIALYRNNIMQTETINFTVAGDIVTVIEADASEIFNVTYSYA